MAQQIENAQVPRVAEEAEVPLRGNLGAQPEAQPGDTHGPDHSLLTEAVAELQAKVDQGVELIKSDRRLDKTEIRQKITRLWERATDAHAALMKAYEQQLEETADERLRSLFYVIPSNRDSVRQAYNDVYDRTQPGFMSGTGDGIESAREEMERLWERAIRTGDRALETAIGQLAIERGNEKLRDAYLSRSEEKTGQWQRYGEARTKLEHWQNPQERMWMRLTRAITLRKPEEA
jgi:hypothetical protein